MKKYLYGSLLYKIPTEFKRICIGYDDNEESFESGCRECNTIDQIKDLKIKPQGAIKKYKDTYATFVNEVYQTFLVSNKLFKYLVQSGIEEKKFRPVFTKNNKVEPLAYQLYM